MIQNTRKRLADLMDARRQTLGLTWDQVANAAGLSREGLRRVREGEREMRSLTKRGIENALAWETGGVDEVLAGRLPEERGVDEPDRRRRRPPTPDERLAAARARLRRLTEELRDEDVETAERVLRGLTGTDDGAA